MKKNIVSLIVILFSIVFIFFGSRICKFEKTDEAPEDVTYAKVLSIGNIAENTYDQGDAWTSGSSEKTINFSAKITRGERKGETILATQTISDMFAAQIKDVKQGDKILVAPSEYPTGGSADWIFVEYNRIDAVIVLCAIFLVLVLVIGGFKGLTTIISLLITCATIFMVYIPSILKGYNIYLSTIIISVFIIIVSLLIIDGANKKTLCAIVGNIGGVAIAGILVAVMSSILKLTGYIDEEYVFLSMVNGSSPINLKAIIWGGIVIGALGAIMDVAMTIASAMTEVAEHMEEKSFSKLLKSAMNIGRDSIGTMTNTLILAYIGGSLAVVLLLIAYSKSTDYLFNMEMIIVEIIQSVIGSIGILFAVPITAVFSACVFNMNPRSKKPKRTKWKY